MVASSWLKTHRMGPFFDGIWNGSQLLLAAPSGLHRLLASDPGGYAALGWGLVAAFASAAIPCRPEERGYRRSAFALAFALSGYPALWAAGDVIVNYSWL